MLIREDIYSGINFAVGLILEFKKLLSETSYEVHSIKPLKYAETYLKFSLV